MTLARNFIQYKSLFASKEVKSITIMVFIDKKMVIWELTSKLTMASRPVLFITSLNTWDQST